MFVALLLLSAFSLALSENSDFVKEMNCLALCEDDVACENHIDEFVSCMKEAFPPKPPTKEDSMRAMEPVDNTIKEHKCWVLCGDDTHVQNTLVSFGNVLLKQTNQERELPYE